MKYKILLCLSAFLLLFSGCKIQSPEDYKNNGEEKIENPITVTLEIDCKTLKGNEDKGSEKAKELIPEDYVILSKTEFTVEDGSTPLELLEKAARENDIIVNKSGGYVKGINGLSEFSFGQTSGWFYFVNDEKCTVGTSGYKLKEGDTVRFSYTLTLE